MAVELGKWPVEPTTLFVVSYYPTNEIDESPTTVGNLLAKYNDAVEAAKDYIRFAGNVGVCTIQPITATIVYPFVEWEDF